MKKILLILPVILLFFACGDFSLSDSTSIPKQPNDNNSSTTNPDGNGGTTNPGGDGDGETTTPGGDGGTTTNPGGDGSDGGDGDGSGTTNPDGSDNGTIINPDGDNSTTTPGGDNSTTDTEDKPGYDTTFDASKDVFNSNLYYGRSLLTQEEQKAYDIIVDTLVKFEITEANKQDARIGIQLTLNGANITLEQVKKIATIIGNDEQRLTYITSFVPKWAANGRPQDAKPSYDGAYIREFFLDVANVKPVNAYAILNETKQQYMEDMKKVEDNVLKILNKLQPDMNEGQKFRLLHDEFIKSVSYGQLLTGSGDIRGGFINFKVLCEGYARSLAYLCQRAGLECIYVVGTASYNGTGGSSGSAFNHAWIKVKIDGQWYNVDPTNNDGMTAGSSYVYYNNFLQSDAEFMKDHTEGVTTADSKVSYDTFPKSATTSYDKNATDYP